MIRLARQLLPLAPLLLAGCSSWPEMGAGGFAEHHLQTLVGPSAAAGTLPEDGLRFELELLSRHLDVLVLEGAELCFPATVVQAQERQNRIAREIAGGLPFDAANDIVVQRNLLARLERQLDYVVGHAVCVLPVDTQQQTPGEFGSRIDALLNSDNQFAFGSAELNPKYVGHLAEAAQLLRERGDYTLRITGHADAVGGAADNAKLSRARAEQVARYLTIFGLPAERLAIDAVGADDPLFAGMQPEVRLTNRRVTIELVESATTTIPPESR